MAQNSTGTVPVISNGNPELDELPSGYWQITLHFLLWFAPFVTASFSLLLTCLRRRRPPVPEYDHVLGRTAANRAKSLLRIERPGDGLFAMEEMGTFLNSLLSMLILTCLVVPWLVLGLAFAFGTVLCSTESWELDEGVPFLQFAMLMLINPATGVAPATLGGKFWCIFIGIVTYVLMNTILGLLSITRCVTALMSRLPTHPKIFFLLLFVLAPLLLMLLGLGVATILVVFEGHDFSTAWLGMMDFITAGGAFNISVSPSLSQPAAVLLIQISLILVQALGGMIIGISGSHPALCSLMGFLEGSDRDDCDEPLPKDAIPEGPKETKKAQFNMTERNPVRSMELCRDPPLPPPNRAPVPSPFSAAREREQKFCATMSTGSAVTSTAILGSAGPTAHPGRNNTMSNHSTRAATSMESLMMEQAAKARREEEIRNQMTEAGVAGMKATQPMPGANNRTSGTWVTAFQAPEPIQKPIIQGEEMEPDETSEGPSFPDDCVDPEKEALQEKLTTMEARATDAEDRARELQMQLEMAEKQKALQEAKVTKLEKDLETEKLARDQAEADALAANLQASAAKERAERAQQAVRDHQEAQEAREAPSGPSRHSTQQPRPAAEPETAHLEVVQAAQAAQAAQSAESSEGSEKLRQAERELRIALETELEVAKRDRKAAEEQVKSLTAKLLEAEDRAARGETDAQEWKAKALEVEHELRKIRTRDRESCNSGFGDFGDLTARLPNPFAATEGGVESPLTARMKDIQRNIAAGARSCS